MSNHNIGVGKRLMSLDALRGFDMFFIIGGHEIISAFIKAVNCEFLNNYIQPQINHVGWEGFTAWDLIMPLFLFIVGVAMPFSFKKRLERGESKKQLYLHIFKRFVILFILGIF